ncbi:hypothetical protein BKA82DRAFT_4011064 [Pisolithus tinctorius]|nr:hypothetical protein BKA82DRAFT_4011064 [Pisolithus tinctorius]
MDGPCYGYDANEISKLNPRSNRFHTVTVARNHIIRIASSKFGTHYNGNVLVSIVHRLYWQAIPAVVFPYIIDAFGGGGLGILSALATLLLVKPLMYGGMKAEDNAFRRRPGERELDVSIMHPAEEAQPTTAHFSNTVAAQVPVPDSRIALSDIWR